MTDKQKEAVKFFYNLRATIEESIMLFDEDINVKCGKETIKQITIVLNIIQTQQAEIEKSRNTKDLYYENKELRKLLEKKDEIIVLILKELYKKAHISTKCYLQKSIKECLKHKNCIECLKQYYERKVENGN